MKTTYFERFYQVKGNPTGNTEGTGIGLTLSKEFIELHDGEIFVKTILPRDLSLLFCYLFLTKKLILLKRVLTQNKN